MQKIEWSIDDHCYVGSAGIVFAACKQWKGSGEDAVCDEAELNEVDRRLLWGRQFLNPFSLER